MQYVGKDHPHDEQGAGRRSLQLTSPPNRTI